LKELTFENPFRYPNFPSINEVTHLELLKMALNVIRNESLEKIPSGGSSSVYLFTVRYHQTILIILILTRVLHLGCGELRYDLGANSGYHARSPQ
jgi:hypothetical protein